MIKDYILAKLMGKLISYVGLLMGIAGIVWENTPLFSAGLFILVVGCTMHELNE